ncbi:hypothetical protein ACFYNL_06190 [Streptomyces sp. NPDC007808]|uniref:DNA polymerase Y family protein n=1 Tax=Streptomyces sp. NPDC007808 TaxID=3364779 RepID=UPI00368136A4
MAAFLRPRPVRELPGVGARTAATLADYGLHIVADVADVPQATLQRLLGARAGRALHEHAHGRDTTVVDPTPAPASLSTEHRFVRDELDPAAHRRVLLALADDVGARLRASGQIATGVTCTVRYADLSASRRSRTLPEATQHTVLLARAAYAVYDSLGLQRARVRSIALRADALRPADRATRQLTLDAGDDKPLAIEAVADRARARYGRQVLYPAALATSTRGRHPGGTEAVAQRTGVDVVGSEFSSTDPLPVPRGFCDHRRMADSKDRSALRTLVGEVVAGLGSLTHRELNPAFEQSVSAMNSGSRSIASPDLDQSSCLARACR